MPWGAVSLSPIPTRAADPFVQFNGYLVALFPFAEGRSCSFEEPFGEADRDQVLEVVVALHGVPIDAIRPLAVDGFIVPWLDQLDQLDHSIHSGAGSIGPHAAAVSQLLVDNEAEIQSLIARYRRLVVQYMRDPGPWPRRWVARRTRITHVLDNSRR